MFERFTDRARRSVVLAQEEAARMRHNYIGTEHLLLGLVAEGEGVAARALTELGLDLDGVRTSVEQIIGRGPDEPKGHIPFTPRAKETMEHSLKEALRLGHNYIGTEHILLGLLREGEGVAAQVLLRRGVGLDDTRAKVIQILSGYTSTAGSAAPPPAEPFPSSRYTLAMQAALARASAFAGDDLVATSHVLAAFAALEDTAAHTILAAGGFDAESLPSPIEEWDVMGTGDEDPIQRAARGTAVIIDTDGLTVRIDDDELRQRLQDALADGDVPVDKLREALGRVWADFLEERENDESDG